MCPKEPDILIGLLESVDLLALLQQELSWIHFFLLKTIIPFGFNERIEIPHPIPFAFQFNDYAATLQTC